MILYAFLGIGLRSAAPDVSIADLRCEYSAEPNNIDCAHPRLSWIEVSTQRNWQQGAYRIIVGSNLRNVQAGVGDLWDSGRVKSNQTNQVTYEGKTLSSTQDCYWRVQVWNAEGDPSDWSSPGHWRMGILASGDWKDSRWIGVQAPAGDHPAPYLRKDFSIDSKIKRATLYACGLGYADVRLNGESVSPGVERDPGYTNFDKRVLYVAYDATRLIHRGRNVLGTVLGTGWYDVHDKATWNFDRAPWRGRPRLRLVLQIEYPDGHKQFVRSDSSWKVTTGGVLRDGIYTGEIFDNRREIKGWDTVGVDDGSWPNADVLPAPKGKLVARTCNPIELGETLKVKAIHEPKPGVYVLDFGQNFAGHVRIRVKASEGTSIHLRYSERLDKEGMIERSQIEQFMAKSTPPQPFQSDTYICNGKGTETWEQKFSYSGFRYVEVTGLGHRPSPSEFEGRFVHTHFDAAGAFVSSNPLINQIQRATLYSYQSNAQNIPTDCPQREKNGWTGDAQLAADAGLMNFQSQSFYTKWLDDLSDTETADGMMSVIVPTGGWGRGARHPAWDSAYAIVADDLFKFQGDKLVFAKHYDGLKRYVDSLATELKEGVLTFDSLGDWLPWKTETPSTYTSTIYLLEDCRILAKAAHILHKEVDAQHYEELAETVKAGINSHFYDAATGTYANGSQTAQSMALYFKLASEADRIKVYQVLKQNVESQGHIDTGILGAKYLLRVLSAEGDTALAYRIVTRAEQPSWGWWIKQGATTLWEDWKGESSLNHIMFGDVSAWFYQRLAGIRPDAKSIGFSHFVIGPEPVGDLTWVSAWYDSPHGRIKSSWRKTGRDFHLEVDIPANSSATVIIPSNGEVTDGGKPVADADGVKSERKQGSETVLELGSGTYVFDAHRS